MLTCKKKKKRRPCHRSKPEPFTLRASSEVTHKILNMQSGTLRTGGKRCARFAVRTPLPPLHSLSLTMCTFPRIHMASTCFSSALFPRLFAVPPYKPSPPFILLCERLSKTAVSKNKARSLPQKRQLVFFFHVCGICEIGSKNEIRWFVRACFTFCSFCMPNVGLAL